MLAVWIIKPPPWARIIGKKANQHFTRRNARVASYEPLPIGANALTVARETANRAIADFIDGKVDRVFLVYNEFINAGTQRVQVRQRPKHRVDVAVVAHVIAEVGHR